MTVTGPTPLQGQCEVLQACCQCPLARGSFSFVVELFGNIHWDFGLGELHWCPWCPQNRVASTGPNVASKEQAGTDFSRSLSHLEGQEMVKPSGHFLAAFPCS